MPIATVKAAFVNPPKDGKRYGNIKTPEGKFYSYDPSKLTFNKGGTYQIEFTEVPSGDRIYNNVTKIIPQAQPSSGGGSVPVNGDEAENIFVTSVIGRSFHGTSTVPGGKEIESMVRSLRMGWRLGMKNVMQSASDEPPDWEPDGSQM